MLKVTEPNGDPKFSFGYSCNDLYSANAVTACLCPKHPNYMGDMVKMFEDHFAGFTQLSEVRWSSSGELGFKGMRRSSALGLGFEVRRGSNAVRLGFTRAAILWD